MRVETRKYTKEETDLCNWAAGSIKLFNLEEGDYYELKPNLNGEHDCAMDFEEVWRARGKTQYRWVWAEVASDSSKGRDLTIKARVFCKGPDFAE